MRRFRSVVVCSVASVLAAAGAASSVSAGTYGVTAIAVTEASQTHPLLGPGQGTATFNIPSTTNNLNWFSHINNAGVVSFRGSSTQAALSLSGNGVWSNAGAGNGVLAFAGAADPNGSPFGATSYTVRQSQSGNLIFSHSSASNVNGGIAAGQVNGAMSRVAYVGDVAPGTGGATYNTAATPTTFATSVFPNNSGQVLFSGALTAGTGSPVVSTATNATNNVALFIGTGGPGNPNANATPVFRMNDDVSGLFTRPGGATGTLHVGTITSGVTTFNDNAKFVTLAAIQSLGASDLVTTGTGNDNLNNNSFLATNRNGSLQALARRGDFAPDTAGNTGLLRYGTISAGFTAINNNQRVAFQTRLTDIQGTTVTPVAAAALFSDHDNGVLKEIARASTPLPTIYAPNDVNLTTPLNSKFGGRLWGGGMTSRMGSDNSLYVSAGGLGGSGGTATGAILRRSTSGVWTSLWAAGDVAIPGGASDGSNITFNALSSAFTLNGAGQVAFSVNLLGTGLSAGNRNNVALMATDMDGSLVMVARLGDFWDYFGDGTDFRQIVGIQTLTQSGPQDGSGVSFNDYGKLVFELQFGDPRIGQPTPLISSSGVYSIWVPSPGAAGVLALSGLVAMRRRRRQA